MWPFRKKLSPDEQKIDNLRKQWKSLTDKELLEMGADLLRPRGLPHRYHVEVLPGDILSIKLDLTDDEWKAFFKEWALPPFEELVETDYKIKAMVLEMGKRLIPAFALALVYSDLARAILDDALRPLLQSTPRSQSLPQVWRIIDNFLKPLPGETERILSPDEVLAMAVIKEVFEKRYGKEFAKAWKKVTSLNGDPFRVPPVEEALRRIIKPFDQENLVEWLCEALYEGSSASMQARADGKEVEMLKAGNVVDLTYYEFEGQVQSGGWLVEEYDNGLLKLTRGPTYPEIVKAADEKREPKKETVVFNIRSIGFLKAEIVGQS